MAAIPPFLSALDLDTDADERAIRRAYAKRLKRIDQETDPAAFQALRETFESALKWAAWQARQNGDAPALPPLARPVASSPVSMPPPSPPPAPAVPPPRPTGPPTLRVVRDEPSMHGAINWDDIPLDPLPEPAPAPVPAPTPVPRSRSPSAAPLPPETPTLSLLQDAKPKVERKPAPVPVAAPVPARASAHAGAPAPAPSPSLAPERTPAPAPARAGAPEPATARAAAPSPVSQPQRTAATSPQPALAPGQNPADLVFADFVERFNRLADGEPVVTREIATALADPRLVNLDARAAFEARIAALIMGGWKPGHEFLFKPACDAFEWERDRRRLDIHGQMGTVLDAAIRERLMFESQAFATLDSQRKLMRRLRTDKPQRAAEIGPSIQMLSMLLQRYPNWMRVMTRQDVVQHWVDTWNAFTPEQRQAGAPTWSGPRTTTATPTRIPPPAKPFKAKGTSSGAFGGFGMIWIVVMVIGAISRMAASSNNGTPAYQYQPPAPPPLRVTMPQDAALPEPPTTHFPSPYTSNLPAQGGFDDSAPTQPMSPAELARRERQAEQLAKRQAQIDALNAKRALRDGSGGSVRYDDQVAPVPDPNVIQGQTPQQ